MISRRTERTKLRAMLMALLYSLTDAKAVRNATEEIDATEPFLMGPKLEDNASNIRMASFFGHTRVFLSLLEDDITRYNRVFDDGWTPLCTAVDRHQVSMIEAILQRDGVDVDVETVCHGRMALYFAASHPDLTMV